MTRLFSHEPLAGRESADLGAAEAHYALRVLRLKPGAAVTVFDGRGGEYEATIAGAGKHELSVELGRFSSADRLPQLELTLIQGVASSERMDWVVQKATELGVERVVPAITARSQRRPGAEQRAQRRRHWHGVALAACRQCGRNRLPLIDEPTPLADCWSVTDDTTRRRLLCPSATTSLGASLDRGGASVELLIGPEGGLTDAERSGAVAAGFVDVRLGPRVLRTETAAISAISVVMAAVGDLD